MLNCSLLVRAVQQNVENGAPLWRGLALVTLLAVLPAHAEWYNAESTAMTTRIGVEFWTEMPDAAPALAEAVFAEFRRIEALMSSYRPTSVLSKINRDAANAAVSPGDELFALIQQAQAISRLSDGAFDITFSSVGVLYDYREHRRPDEQALKQALRLIDYRKIEMDSDKRTVRFLLPEMRLDLGGIAKGYAVDRGLAILQAAGILHARVSAGGDMRLLGDRLGKPWVLGVKDPRSMKAGTPENAVILPLADTAVSTSGDYERFYMDGDERVHHIVSPKTGQSASGLQSVTVLGPDATTTDGLSTAIFVLGLEKGLALVNRLNGIDAILIDQNHRLHYSKGLAPPN